MNPILRQRIPACVRTLLTDIRPRGEQLSLSEENEEIEAPSLDGIKLPGRGAAEPGELLTPAGMREESKEGDVGLRKDIRVCGLCLSKPPSYTCPRCNVPYCDLACYRSLAHSVCSEEFYKESVIRELRGTGETEEEGKRRMREILVRLSKEGAREGGAAEAFQETEEGGEDGALENGEILVLISRLAEIQSSGEGDAREIRDILTRLAEIGGEEGEGGRTDGSAAGRGDDGEPEEEEEPDLAERFSGLDVESLTEEELWALLPQRDRERFEGLVKGGAIGGLVPPWRPWWERHEGGEGGKGALVELLAGDGAGGEGRSGSGEAVKTEREEEVKKGGLKARDEKRVVEVEEERGRAHGKGEKGKPGGNGTERIAARGSEEDGGGAGPCGKETSLTPRGREKRTTPPRTGGERKGPGSSVPRVNGKIPPLDALSTRAASPLVRYGLANALFGYAASLSLFNGDLSEPGLVQEFCRTALTASEALSSGAVFGSLREAVEAATGAARESGCFAPGDPGAPARATEAVAHILSGESRRDGVGYTLAALSQLRTVLRQARAALPKEADGGGKRREYFLAAKKCEFLQSWVKDNGPAVRLLAGQVWREHVTMDKERKCLDKEKKAVEESWKKGRGREKGKLIEEVD